MEINLTAAEIKRITGCTSEALVTLYSYHLIIPDRSGPHYRYSLADADTVRRYQELKKQTKYARTAIEIIRRERETD